MSALPPKADIAGRRLDVRLVPKADIAPNTRELFFLSSRIRLFVRVAQLRASAEPAAERRYGLDAAR
jgi:hypothetical protein